MRCLDLNDLPPPPPGKTGFPWTEESQSLPANMPDGRAWPKVSVVTPSFNQATFLEETIRSVLLQSYSNLEYIIVDGGSTDGSVDVIRRYAPWLTYWVSEPDAGQSDAINKGWSYCTGDILAWLNSDDYYTPNTLRRVAERFAADPALGLVYGEIFVLDAHGARSGAIGYHASEAGMLVNLEIPYQPASFLNRTVVQLLGTVDSSLRYVMDVDILLRVMANAPFARIASPFAVFRIHDDSKTNLAEARFADEVLILLQRVLEHPATFPALQAMGQARVASNFRRLAAKHYYQGNHFIQSLEQIVLACRAHPASTPAILCDEGVGWLVRRLLPIRQYRTLSHFLRSPIRLRLL